MSRSPATPRVVIDTNLVLSALLFAHGRLVPLRQVWHARHCIPLICSITTAELIRVLAYPKFKLSIAEQGELLADYLPYCETVILPDRLPAVPECRDEHDLPFLHLAVVGKADALLTGDQDLLSLAKKFSRPIMTAEAWLASFAPT